MKNVSSILKLSVCVVVIFILAFLLKIGHVWIVVDCLIEIMDFFIGNGPLWIFEEFMIKVKTNLSLTVIEFEGIAVVMSLERLV